MNIIEIAKYLITRDKAKLHETSVNEDLKIKLCAVSGVSPGRADEFSSYAEAIGPSLEAGRNRVLNELIDACMFGIEIDKVQSPSDLLLLIRRYHVIKRLGQYPASRD